MPYSYDYLAAALRCSRCGREGAALDMITRLRPMPELASLGVGDPLPVSTDNAVRSGYLALHEPTPGEPTVLLHVWTCPHCAYAFNWAEVVVRDNVIEAIRSADLTRAVLGSAHFIVDDAREVAADLAGTTSSLDLDDDTVVAVLRDKLPRT
ncbi:hypothetical protein ACFORO_19325 [Amycolatopsis halotolerans]|uniref:Uncharacterized protein n=1 Tax=Amycolatopsis halotolerans TaxID=330083 RepID=A0ABV7QHQ7_9PSEU